MDMVHKATKIIDHNRWTVAGLAMLASTMILGSCGAFDGKTVSTTSGKVLDADGLKSEYVIESKTLQAHYDDAMSKIAEAQRQIEMVNQAAEELNVGYVADAQVVASEIEARNSKIGAVADLVSSIAGVPWLLPLVSIGTTSVAAGAVADNRRKDKKIKQAKTGGSITT